MTASVADGGFGCGHVRVLKRLPYAALRHEKAVRKGHFRLMNIPVPSVIYGGDASSGGTH